MSNSQLFSSYRTLSKARRGEVARLLAAVGVLSGASLGTGALWATAQLHPISPLDKGLLATLPLIAVGAVGFIALRLVSFRVQQQKSETDLRAAQSRFKDSFEQFPLGIQTMGLDGFNISVNRVAQKLFGAPEEELQEHNLLTDPALRIGGILPYLETALEGSLAVAPITYYNIRQSWPKSGHELGVHAWLKTMFCPIKDNDGNVIEVLIIHEDVTQQTEARAALSESEARKSAIIESALDCIISIDSDGHIIEWNPSAETTFGFSRAEAMGQLLADLIIPVNLRDQHTRGLKNYIATGAGTMIGRKIEVTAVRANGEEFPIELTITPITIGEKQIFSGFLRDLTQAKAAQTELQKAHSELESRVVQRTVELRTALEQLQTNYERLEQLEALRDTLTGMIVHDLRTPLNSMLFGLQTIPFLGAVNPAQQECLNVFALGCKDSLAVINDLLDLGKMESGAFALRVEECDVAALVEQALENVAMLAQIKNLQLVAQVADNLPSLPADKEKVGRLLNNLLGNAIKFVPISGTITLGAELSPDETEIQFWVRDNGVGIPPEAFQRIFEKFGQADSRLGARETSSGLGLTFCKMIVEAHGGQIWVESEPGQGSVFTATFPLASKS